MSFAASWGYDRIDVLNLFAFRSPYPKDLETAEDPVGPENDTWIRKITGLADITIAAWGAIGAKYPDRVAAVGAILPKPAYALKITKHGHPQHPLYIPAKTAPVVFEI